MSRSFIYATFLGCVFTAGCGSGADSASTLESADTETASQGAERTATRAVAPSCAEDTSDAFVACGGLKHGSRCLQATQDPGECTATAHGACTCDPPLRKDRISRRLGETAIDG